MLRAISNMSWQQHPTRHQLYGQLPPITKTIQARPTRHAGHCWGSGDELINDVLFGRPHMAEQKQDNQLEHTYSSYVRIRDVVVKTYQRRWTIGRRGERGSGISVPAARHDDDDDDDDIYDFKQVWLCNTNYSIQYYSLFCTQLNGSKYCYQLLPTQAWVELWAVVMTMKGYS